MVEEKEMTVRLKGRFIVPVGKEDWLATHLERLLDERSSLWGYRPELNSKSGASLDFHQWGSWEAGSDWSLSPTAGECRHVWHRVGVQRRLLDVRMAPIASVLGVLDHVLHQICSPCLAAERDPGHQGSAGMVEIDAVEVQLPPAPRLDLARLVTGAELSASWLEMSSGQQEIPVELSAAGDPLFATSPYELTAALASRWSFLHDVLHSRSMEPKVDAAAENPGAQASPDRVSWQISVPEWSMTSITWLLVNVNAVLRSVGAGGGPPGITLSARRLDRA